MPADLATRCLTFRDIFVCAQTSLFMAFADTGRPTDTSIQTRRSNLARDGPATVDNVLMKKFSELKGFTPVSKIIQIDSMTAALRVLPPSSANTDTKLLIYGLFQKGRVLAQDVVAGDGSPLVGPLGVA